MRLWYMCGKTTVKIFFRKSFDYVRNLASTFFGRKNIYIKFFFNVDIRCLYSSKRKEKKENFLLYPVLKEHICKNKEIYLKEIYIKEFISKKFIIKKFILS